MTKKRYFNLVCVLYLSSSCSQSYADSTGKFPGVGSLESYNRSIAPGRLGEKKYEEGDYENSIRYTRQAIAIYPHDSALYQNLGNALRKAGKLKESVTAQNRAIELERNYLSAWIGLGLSFEGLHKFADAEKCYRKAVELKPQSFEATADLGDILRQQKRYEEARKWLLRARQLSRDPVDIGNIDKCLKDCD